MYQLLSGAIMMACFVSGIFFFKFWQKTRDKLFIMFGAAFWILSLERFVLGYLGVHHEIGPIIYLIRLTAFVLILIAIVHKNRESEKG